MNLSFVREDMVDSLQRIVGAAEKKLTKPILGHVRIRESNGTIRLDTTDLEIAWKAFSDGNIDEGFECTVNARKFFDVVKAAPAEAEVRGRLSGERLLVSFGASRFTLATLPGRDFPEWEETEMLQWLEIPQRLLRRQVEGTMFSMAQQDVRYYLQGLLLAAKGLEFRTVATDGHRLAVYEAHLEHPIAESQQCILPRKTVTELRRSLGEVDDAVRIGFGSGQMTFAFGRDQLTTKLIEGRFPDYERVIPTDHTQCLVVEREHLREVLNRAAIVASDKLRGIRLILRNGEPCKIVTHNTEREEAEELLEGEYEGVPFEIGFNLTYLMDVLAVMNSDRVKLQMKDEDSSTLITAEPEESGRYVVMPMRL
jgi:DNA polymerase-3 subunit beta